MCYKREEDTTGKSLEVNFISVAFWCWDSAWAAVAMPLSTGIELSQSRLCKGQEGAWEPQCKARAGVYLWSSISQAP